MTEQQTKAQFPQPLSLTPDERAALARLKVKPLWGNRKHQRPFQQTVQAYLSLIQALASEKLPRNPAVVRSFQRRAKRVRHFVTCMTQPMSEQLARAFLQRQSIWPPPLPWSSFPARELLLYADNCERLAKFFAGKDRHTASDQNKRIVELLAFVRFYTGTPHLREMATLLKRHGYIGLTAAHLDQLYRYHRPIAQAYINEARSRIPAFVADMLLQTHR
jgi:hypothetical protein